MTVAWKQVSDRKDADAAAAAATLDDAAAATLDDDAAAAAAAWLCAYKVTVTGSVSHKSE